MNIFLKQQWNWENAFGKVFYNISSRTIAYLNYRSIVAKDIL